VILDFGCFIFDSEEIAHAKDAKDSKIRRVRKCEGLKPRRRWGQGGNVALLRSVSVNLAELRRAPRAGGWGGGSRVRGTRLRADLGFLILDFGLGTLLRSVSVNLAELRRAPVAGGWGECQKGIKGLRGGIIFPRVRGTRFRVDFAPQLRDALMRGFWIGDPTTLSLGKPR